MKKVLIVEDDELLLSLLEGQFTDSGYKVIKAGNGEEGLSMYRQEKPDIIIADIIMPKKSGLEMLKEIHAEDESDPVPFIILTNTNDMDVMSDAIAHKATAYLVKANQQLDALVALVQKKIGK